MKLRNNAMLVGLVILGVSSIAHAHEDVDACKVVFKACAAQGFTKDETAQAGMKIWVDCADPIVNHNKAVAKVDVDPNGFDAHYCHDYRVAKDKFDQEWFKKHPAKK